MIIKCPKSTMLLLCSNYLLIGIAMILWIQFGIPQITENVAAILSILFGAIVIYLTISLAVYFGKTIELSKEGCTVRFLFFTKFYPWSHYKTKRYQKARGRKTVAISISAILLLFPHRLGKTSSPMLWCQMLCPFSGICLAFQPPKATKVFEIDESILSKLLQWNVSIDGL